ncbi:MAG: hypothetical protein SFV21_20680 [Rhodospirillaceae bacterium]|nr:hypothetical protein [Rhodospirillaceae bacterium]
MSGAVATLYVVKSKALQEWGGDVGISKHLYAVVLSEAAPAEFNAQLNAQGLAGQTDWQVIAKRETDATDADAVMDKIAVRVNRVDPVYYPRIKGARNVFKINLRNIEASLVVKMALETGDAKVPKVKPADIGNYLLDAATA